MTFQEFLDGMTREMFIWRMAYHGSTKYQERFGFSSIGSSGMRKSCDTRVRNAEEAMDDLVRQRAQELFGVTFDWDIDRKRWVAKEVPF